MTTRLYLLDPQRSKVVPLELLEPRTELHEDLAKKLSVEDLIDWTLFTIIDLEIKLLWKPF